MRKTLSLIFLLVSMAASVAAPVVTLKATATASADPFVLGDIADIKAPAVIEAKLASSEMGRAPLPGNLRTITLGDVTLKLRQAGFDPDTIGFTGATTIIVSPVGQAAQATTPTAGATPAAGTASATLAVPQVARVTVLKPGSHVTVLYNDGPVSITLDGAVINPATIGQLTQVRTTFSDRILTGTLIDDHTVQL